MFCIFILYIVHVFITIDLHTLQSTKIMQGDAYPANTIDIINNGHMYASTNGSLVSTIHLATIFDMKQVPNQFVCRRLN